MSEEILYMFKDSISKEQRAKGDYWTPTDWCAVIQDEARNVFGRNWLETVMVDPCAGGGHLTSGIKPSFLIQSTLEHQDVETLGGPMADDRRVVYQQDFLNSLGFSPEAEKMLKKARDLNMPVTVIMNPPYAAPGQTAIRLNTKKSGITFTVTQSLMNGLPGSNQLYVQFLYKAIFELERLQIKHYRIIMLSAITYLIRPSWRELHRKISKYVGLVGGFVFPSSDFSDITSKWMVLVAYFDSKFKGLPPPRSYRFGVRERDRAQEGQIIYKGKQNFFLITDKATAEAELKRVSPERRDGAEVPPMTTGVRIRKNMVGKLEPGSLGMFTYNQLYLQDRDSTYWTSTAGASPRGVSATEESMKVIVPIFATLRILNKSWLNEKHPFFRPTHDIEWFYNALLWLCFNKQNNSFGGTVFWANQTWRLYNHLFWMTKEEVRDRWPELDFDEPEFSRVTNRPYYDDTSLFSDEVPYARKMLENGRDQGLIWPETEAMISGANQIIDRLYRTRLAAATAYQVNRWDAGYFQLRSLMYIIDDQKHFLGTLRDAVRSRLKDNLHLTGIFGDHLSDVLEEN